MDPRIRSIMQEIKRHEKTSFSWKRGQPAPQPYYAWQNSRWVAVSEEKDAQPATNTNGTELSVVSWNIDFMRAYAQQRMEKALDFLKAYTETIPRPCFVMLNEMLKSDLEQIQAQPWVRDEYRLTDLTDEYWESGYYGTCILIPKDLAVSGVFRVHYDDTAMERDALFVDVSVADKTIRVCSTHLESLIADPPKRPSQLAQAAKFMHAVDGGSILAGDLNAIQDFDKTLHSDNGLKDACLESGGNEDAESAMTWGQMARTVERDRFGLSRMDKVLFCGALNLEHFETFGLDVVLEDGDDASDMMTEGIEKPWVTDHLGVRADYTVVPAPRSVPNL